jgi:hypothetical protein
VFLPAAWGKSEVPSDSGPEPGCHVIIQSRPAPGRGQDASIRHSGGDRDPGLQYFLDPGFDRVTKLLLGISLHATSNKLLARVNEELVGTATRRSEKR